MEENRKRFRFGLRTLMVGFVALGLFFGAVGACVRYETLARQFRRNERPLPPPRTLVGEMLDEILGTPND